MDATRADMHRPTMQSAGSVTSDITRLTGEGGSARSIVLSNSDMRAILVWLHSSHFEGSNSGTLSRQLGWPDTADPEPNSGQPFDAYAS
jgi:hypothetical protein